MFRIDEIETRAHRFVIGDALRIVALHDAHYGRRELNVVFLHHLEVAYDIDLGGRGNEGNAVEHILREKCVGNLDDSLCTKLLGVEVIAYGHMLVEALDAEDSHSLKQHRRRYSVDNRAVTQCRYGEFFL